jgi:hypothetical protein
MLKNTKSASITSATTRKQTSRASLTSKQQRNIKKQHTISEQSRYAEHQK